MNARLLAPAWLSLLVWLWGCADDPRQASTEVENELSARLVVGSAMDSEAIASAEVTAWDASGTLLATGTTDSVGRFSLALASPPEGAILVRVRKATDTLRALAPLDGISLHRGVVGLNVNGFSEAAMPSGMGADPSKGFPPQNAWSARQRGQSLMTEVVGLKLDWTELAHDTAFRPVSFRSAREPSPYAGFLRALESRASREGREGDEWLRSLEGAGGKKVASDSLFAVDLARTIASLGLPHEKTEIVMRSFDSAAGHPGVWEDVWKDKQILSDPLTLQVRVPWATRPEHQAVWRRLVEISLDEAVAFEASLAPEVRSRIRPGRAQEILATAVGGFLFPDSETSGRSAALDTFLLRMLPQARMALGQVRPDAWIPSPPPPREGPDRQGRDGVADLIGFSLSSQLPFPLNWSGYQNQADPGAWMRANHRPWTSSQAALDTLRATLARHSDFRFPAPPLP